MARPGEEPGVNPDDLIEIAESLASGRLGHQVGKPRQAELRRSVSAAYYALFHTLAGNCADLLVGGRSSTPIKQAWRQTYRALDHGQVSRQCTERRSKRVLAKFPQAIRDFAEQFVRMQRERHLADYDPYEGFTRSTVLQLIEETKAAIADFRQVDRADRRAFAIFVLFQMRRD